MSDKKNIEDVTVDDLFKVVRELRFNQRRFKKSSATRREKINKTLEPLENQVDEMVSLYYQRQQKLF